MDSALSRRLRGDACHLDVLLADAKATPARGGAWILLRSGVAQEIADNLRAAAAAIKAGRKAEAP